MTIIIDVKPRTSEANEAVARLDAGIARLAAASERLGSSLSRMNFKSSVGITADAASVKRALDA